MRALIPLIGKELPLPQVSHQLYFWAQEQRAPVYGALHVTCADESEKECADLFGRHVAAHLLPPLKFGEGSHFRLANLGAHYEWGAVPMAESHYATAESRDTFKVIVAKINSHVAVYKTKGGVEYGRKLRYGRRSAYCGALDALLEGSVLPEIKELEEFFQSEGKDRLSVLRDPRRVDPRHRMLLAAVVQARLQARRAVLDIQNMTQRSPTLFLVVPCVTFNRDGEDTEIVVGLYRADLRGTEAEVAYRGLCDDPSKYEVKEAERPLRLCDDQIDQVRMARDHRRLVIEKWIEQKKLKPPPPKDEAIEKVLHEKRRGAHRRHGASRVLLKTLVTAMAGLTPATAAVVLFGEGLIGIHHAARMHQLALGAREDEAARRILDEFHDTMDTLPPERAQAVIDLLLAEYEGGSRHR